MLSNEWHNPLAINLSPVIPFMPNRLEIGAKRRMILPHKIVSV